MARTLRLLGAAVLLAALAPLAAAQDVDCADAPLAEGAVDPAYAHCTQQDAVAPPVEDPTDSAFGINNAAAAFGTFQLSGPGIFFNCGPYTPPGGGFLNAGDFRGNDLTTWYGVDNLGQAIAVDVATCAITQLGIMGAGWTAATWDFVDDTFYGLRVDVCGSGSQLYELDFGTLTATPRGGLDATNGCGIGLASHPTTGVLYSYDLSLDQALTIDKTTGASTVLGPIGFDANFGQGMDFDNEDGTCYLCAFNNLAFVSELRTMNLQTGMTTLIGTLGVGLQQFGTCSVMNTVESGCDITFLASDLSYDAGTRRLTVTVTVRNNGNDPNGARLELDYNRNGGNPQGTRVLGSGTLPPGAQVTRSISLRVPGAAPDGNYNFTLRLVDPATGTDCATYTETIAISAPRVGDAAVGGDFDVEAVADLTPAASVAAGGAAVTPNPFADRARIAYEVAEAAPVRLAVYDLLGREVAVLVDEHQEAGAHAATFDARGLAAGTYVYRLTVGSDVQTGQLTLAR
ncbi:MAG TPA: T9SS type A sorting domain-containing protein [Rubricoccaceae bacterium]|nr:T9SS type A sorting domain-containing protein [Rubricoccaceae bacterium]